MVLPFMPLFYSMVVELDRREFEGSNVAFFFGSIDAELEKSDVKGRAFGPVFRFKLIRRCELS